MENFDKKSLISETTVLQIIAVIAWLWVIFAKNINSPVGSVEMRYVGHLMKFEDAHTTFYESTMNSDTVRTAGRKEVTYQHPRFQPYNSFDEFDPTNNEFVQ